MAHNNYTTVKEMTEKVNRLYNLLEEARELAKELATDNLRNHSCLFRHTDEACSEWRPLTWEERKEEAKAYYKMFDELGERMTETINNIRY